MPKTRWLIAAVITAVGALQGWDSDVLDSTVVVQVLVGLAIALPAVAALLGARRGIGLAAVLSCAVLLVLARIVSPVNHNELLLVALVAGAGLLGGEAIARRATAQPN